MDGQIIDPVIEIGDEKYLLHMMNRVELEGYLRMAQNNPELGKMLAGFEEDMPLIRDGSVYMTKTNGTRKYFMDLSVCSLLSDFTIINQLRIGSLCSDGTLDTEDADSEDEFNWVCWMPALIPLNKAGESMRNVFRKDNPNGTIVHGLYFLVDDKAHGLIDFKRALMSRNMRMDSDLTIVEFGSGSKKTKPITWICYDGMLVPMRAFAKVPLGTLYKRSFLPTIST